MKPYRCEIPPPFKRVLLVTIVAVILLSAHFFSSNSLAASERPPPSESAESFPGTELPQTDSVINPSELSPEHISVDYFKGYIAATVNILASPRRADTSDWLKVGGVVAITGGLVLADANIRDFSRHNHGAIANSFSSAGQMLGSPLYTIPPVGAFYLYGHLRNDGKARQTSLLALESLAISTLFTEALKVTAQRQRPNKGASPYKWEGPNFNLTNVSFCSGHTSSAFSIASVFAEQYKESQVIPPVAYGLATLAGLSRIYDNKHWASDVFFGAALGYFVGKSVVGFHTAHGANKTNISVAPDLRPNYNGITVQYVF